MTISSELHLEGTKEKKDPLWLENNNGDRNLMRCRMYRRLRRSRCMPTSMRCSLLL